MKRFRRRKSIRLIPALAVLALVVVPVAQAKPDFYPGAQQVAQPAVAKIHGVPASLYQRLPADDQAALAGTGSIGGYAPSATQAFGTIHGVPASLYQRLPADDQAALAGTGSIGGYAPATFPKQAVPGGGSGFAWSTAGIGIGAALAGLMLLAILSLAVASRRKGLAQA